MRRPKTTISEVWRQGWRQEAAETQGASAELAACLNWLEQNGHGASAKTIREIALQDGVRKAVAAFGAALRTLSLTTSNGKRP